jgi:hypothetical protein
VNIVLVCSHRFGVDCIINEGTRNQTDPSVGH